MYPRISRTRAALVSGIGSVVLLMDFVLEMRAVAVGFGEILQIYRFCKRS